MDKMRVADAIMHRLGREVDTIFYLPGGGSGAMVDALGRTVLHAVCCLHEQGAGFAAVGYAMTNGLGVCLTTTGPGATNAITPCLAAWMDSVPVIFISGQVMRKWLAMPGMRFRGVQEAPIIDIVKPITKDRCQPITGKFALRRLDELIDIAKSGRAGPVWLDVPMDVQVEYV